jgi:hypothetical protein
MINITITCKLNELEGTLLKLSEIKTKLKLDNFMNITIIIE